jgi:hypothetical protein
MRRYFSLRESIGASVTNNKNNASGKTAALTMKNIATDTSILLFCSVTMKTIENHRYSQQNLALMSSKR